MAEFINFVEDEPHTVTFKYNQGIEKFDEKFKKMKYTWGVRESGQEKLISATELLNSLMLKTGAKKDVTATICKHPIPGQQAKYWTCLIDGVERDSRFLDDDASQPTSKPQSHDLQKPGFDPKAHMDYMQYLCEGMRRRLPDWTSEDARATAISIYIGTPNGCHSAPAEDDMPF